MERTGIRARLARREVRQAAPDVGHRVAGAWAAVLLDRDPAVVAGGPEGSDHAWDVDGAGAERAEHAGRDGLPEPVAAADSRVEILQVDVPHIRAARPGDGVQ